MTFVPVFLELPYCDPIELASQLGNAPRLIFFDSAIFHPERGRYSYLSFAPVEWYCGRVGESQQNPFDLPAHKNFPCETLPDLPPFQGGVAGLWSYDLVHAIEKLPRPKYRDFSTPDWALGIYDWVLSWDHQQKKMWLVSTGYPAVTELEQQKRAQDRLQYVLEVIAAPPRFESQRGEFVGEFDWGAVPRYPLMGHNNVFSNFDSFGYQQAVQRAIDYIHAGDCFQVNLSQRLVSETKQKPFDLYQRLRQVNPAPFAGFFDMGTTQILSASPERFLEVRKGHVSTRPIKGTRRKAEDPEEDRRRIHDLLHSPKDRAENVMIVDLLRNDLGKSCRYGTVKVTKLCELETFQFVHHMVSEVQGTLLPNRSPLSLLRGAFPGGSVTGAPKVRSMEIISELEPTHRGAYCGSLGYVGFDQSMDTNILIRTFTQQGAALAFPVGGGIVADSQPAQEYEETLHKAAGLLRALS